MRLRDKVVLEREVIEDDIKFAYDKGKIKGKVK